MEKKRKRDQQTTKNCKKQATKNVENPNGNCVPAVTNTTQNHKSNNNNNTTTTPALLLNFHHCYSQLGSSQGEWKCFVNRQTSRQTESPTEFSGCEQPV
jgi:hypothetical protein